MGGVAIVTGAGSGVGRAAALALLRDGWSVGLAGRRAEALEETVKLAGEAGANALPVAADVSKPGDVEALFSAVVGRWGRLDCLFNNAGAGAPASTIDEMSIEDWKKVVDVNLTGAFLCARAAFAQMRKQAPQGGRIINNGSISAYVPRPGSAPYTATKHGVAGLTKTVALDGRPFDIQCNQIDIGNAGTPMTERMSQGVAQADGSVKPEPVMDVRHVGDAVATMAGLPLDAAIQTMTIMTPKMPFIGRG